MSVVIVTGVPGVGKSTVMAAAEEYGYKIVNFGTIMFEEAQKEGVANRDDMRKLAVEDQQRLQKQAGEKISQMGDVVVDTHASILTPSGYMPGLPEWTARALNPDVIVLVEAALTCAPASMRTCTIPAQPMREACMSAVFPCESAAFADARVASSARTASSWP